MNFLNRFNNILYHFLMSLLIRKSSFSKSDNFIMYYNNIISFKTVLKLILIIKKSFIITTSYKRSIKKITL